MHTKKETTYLIRGLVHIALLTEDVDDTAEFYIRNFGFRDYYENMSPKGFRLRHVELGHLVLEIIGAGKAQGPGPILHFALEVCGLEGLVAELKEKGIVPSDEQIVYEPDLFPSGIKHVMISGPAGEQIELYEMGR